MNKIYDTIIIGGGPAGLSAGVYAGRANLNTLTIEKQYLGGQAVTTSYILSINLAHIKIMFKVFFTLVLT